MQEGIFTVAKKRPIRKDMTVSRGAGISEIYPTTWFSLGADTSISQETYDQQMLYIGAQGSGNFLLGTEEKRVCVCDGDMLLVPGGTLCGTETETGFIYTEIILKKEINMNKLVKAGEAMQLKDLISYEEGSIANLDLVHNDTMKFVLMAFAEGTGLTPHRAPGNAIVTALEGKAVIGYEGKDYPISAGESFRFEKNGLHSVTADGKFKMSLLLVLE